MKRKIGLFLSILFGLGAIGGTCVAISCANSSQNAIVARAEGEEEQFECSVVVAETEHGKISVDKDKGHVGDIVSITIKHDLFYLIESVAVNGTNLVESEETSGLYSFALVKGENKIEAKIVVDQNLLGEMAVVYDQARNKDWTNLFTIENVIRIVTFVLNGGILIAIVRYFIKDKKIAKNVERSVQESVTQIVPSVAKDTIIANTKEVLEPVFAQISGYQEEIVRVMAVLVKCVALMQEDTPDAKRAVLGELANLQVGDMKVIEEAKNTIDKYFVDKMNEVNDILSNLNNIIEKNKEVAEKTVQIAEQEKVEEKPLIKEENKPLGEEKNVSIEDDGTQF